MRVYYGKNNRKDKKTLFYRNILKNNKTKAIILCALFASLTALGGFPVFTKGGGLSYIFEPTFGYIIGFVLCAFITGKIIEKTKKHSFTVIFLSSLAGLTADYLAGVFYLYVSMNFYLNSPTPLYSLLWTGALIFLPKDAILCAAASLVGSRLLPVLKRENVI